MGSGQPVELQLDSFNKLPLRVIYTEDDPIYGDTLLLVLNAGTRSKPFHLPTGDGAGTWQEVINTARSGATTPHTRRTGQGLAVSAHSLVLLRWLEGE